MNLWDRLSTLALWPVTRVPWGMDRGVSDTEYARYRSNFHRGVIAYFALLLVTEILGEHLPLPLRYAAAVVPFTACGFLIATLVRYVSHWDELQRRILAEAAAVSLALGLGLLLTYNYLQDIGLPPIAPKWIVSAFFMLWLIALPVVRKQYES